MTRRFYMVLCCLCMQLTWCMAQQRWWGYYTDSDSPAYMGVENAETYTCGVQLSASRTILNGATIHGVRFYLRDKTNVSEVKVWLSTTRPASADAANIQVVEVPQSQLVDLEHDQKMLEVTLPQTYVLQSGTVQVGYAFKMSSAKTAADKQPVVCSGGSMSSGAFWIRTSKSLLSWNDMGARHGALALQVLVSNDALPQQAVSVSAPDRMVGVAGTQVTTTVPVTSAGLQSVNAIDYVVTVDGQAQAEQHCQLPTPIYAPGNTASLPIAFTMPASTGIGQYSVRVTKVNGVVPAQQSAAVSAPLLTVTRLGHHRSVVEEFTGTWCTNCPRGIVGMQNLARQFGDDFIGIAVHTNNGSVRDPMYLGDYSSLIPQTVPNCTMDRILECDPYLGIDRSNYHYHADKAFQLVLSQPVEADLSVEAAWTDDTETQLQLTAATTFYVDAPTADYALAFVLTEDGQSGTTQEWWQVNGESGKSTFPDADMAVFREAADPVTDLVYNHVPIATQGIQRGLDGSIQQPLLSGQTQSYSVTFDLSTNQHLQDKNHLTAIVMLLSQTTGRIVNAAKTRVVTSTGVESVVAVPASSDRYYTLDGRVVKAPAGKGLYINNGKKIIIL